MAAPNHGSVIPGEYLDTIVTGPPLRQEDPALWQHKTYTDDDIKKELGIPQEQLDMARANLGFPVGTLVTSTKFSLWGQKQTMVTSAAL